MKIGVVILNYNGWQDTLACAESVLASSTPPAWLVIVDNASDNDSLRWLRHWAAGNMEFALPELGAPSSCPKPLLLTDITPAEIPATPRGQVVLLRRPCNDGYAAGNNAGIRLLLQWGADAVWILNNDTVVHRDALGHMARRLFAKARPGLCGSQIRYMEPGDLLQCRGGGFTSKWTGLSVLDGNRQAAGQAQQIPPDIVEKRINFIYGASVMASRAFIEEVGLMDERYFLYCEEQDWAYSAGGRFDFAYAADALVWHREGASTGHSCRRSSLRRLLAITKSRLLLTGKHFPVALPAVCLAGCYAAMRMVVRRLLYGGNHA